MTLKKKTFKDQREEKDLHARWKGSREGKRPLPKVRGGKQNLISLYHEEKEEEGA